MRNIYDSPLFKSALIAAPPAPSARPRMPSLTHVDKRMYAGARKSRLTADFGVGETSADAELHSSLVQLRARSRELVRDAAFAQRARNVTVNNVIGSGIGLQGQVRSSRDKLRAEINDGIEAAWWSWCAADRCHTGGVLHFHQFERAAMCQVFEAGEVFIRVHRQPFGSSRIPIALELIEAERLAQHYVQPTALPEGSQYRMGVEHDAFGRPLAYWIRDAHPGDLKWSRGGAGAERLTRVPADQMFHLRLITRWPQTRGEPWLHAVLRKLHDVDGYSESEVVAARAAAAYMGIIETPDQEGPLSGEAQADGSREFDLAPGTTVRLNPGEKFGSYTPNRPNAAMEGFMRHMLREIGVGADVPYESISGDYSQSNYSSSRLSLLESRDTWKHLQQWFIQSFREPLHKLWLESAVLSGAIPAINRAEYAIHPDKYESVQFKPRGWSWVDPTKEVAAYKDAIAAGFTTVTAVIAATGNGQDLEEVLDERERELQMMADKGLKFDTSPVAAAPTPPPIPAADEQVEALPATAPRVVPLRR